METKLVVILSFLLAVQFPLIFGHDQGSEDMGKFAEAAAEFFQSQGGEALGSAVQGLMGSALSGALSGSDGGKAAGDLGRLLQGLGSTIGQNTNGIDPEMISGLVGMIGNSLDPKKKEQGGTDIISLLSTVTNALAQSGNAEILERLAAYIPMVIDFFNEIASPEGQEREGKHADHSWALPPLLERLHILSDHFMNSEFGRKIIASIGAEKIIKIFSDENGNFSYDRFVELMENHSFRRHWIQMVILRAAKFIEYYSDPRAYQQYMETLQFVVNGFLSSQGFPKSVLLNMNAPIQSLSVLADYLTVKYLGVKIMTRKYIEPIGAYLKYILDSIKKVGIAKGGAETISAKLADSINLEIIEPIASVNRAYRFLKKNPKCDRYVLCLVNQEDTNRNTIPGLKMLLSKGTSFVASWALSSLSEASMFEYFNIIMYEEDCQKYFKPACSDYHNEEVRVTTEYIHNEL